MSLKRLLASWVGKTDGRSRFQILSDLHLEIGQQYGDFQVPVKAPNLVLAGDIGRLIDYDNYLRFLVAQTSRFDHVFLVLGNHEFYGMTFDAGIARARQLEAEPSLNGKLVLLHQARWADPASGATVLGCTLWSHIPPEAASITASRVNDFKKITGWTTDAHNAQHASDSAWLHNELANLSAKDTPPLDGNERTARARTVLVVTHHAPCVEGTSHPKDAGNPWSAAFSTDMLGTGEWSNFEIRCWVFGHTHYTTDMVRGGVRIVSNQRGYVLPGLERKEKSQSRGSRKEEKLHGFDVARVIEL